jgi:hypothetical protein
VSDSLDGEQLEGVSVSTSSVKRKRPWAKPVLTTESATISNTEGFHKPLTTPIEFNSPGTELDDTGPNS